MGEFVENLRRELHPNLPHLAAHITFLPPRLLRGTEAAALQMLAGICSQAEPFEVTLGDVQSFVPTTPTVYIRVTSGAARLQELHDQLNKQILAFAEEWPYIPHLTVVKMATEPMAEQALRDRPRTLAAVRGKPPHPARPAHLCARRRAELLGRSGSGAARRQPGYAVAPSRAQRIDLPLPGP